MPLYHDIKDKIPTWIESVKSNRHQSAIVDGTKSLNNGNYHIEYENQESPRNEKPESQDERK